MRRRRQRQRCRRSHGCFLVGSNEHDAVLRGRKHRGGLLPSSTMSQTKRVALDQLANNIFTIDNYAALSRSIYFSSYFVINDMTVLGILATDQSPPLHAGRAPDRSGRLDDLETKRNILSKKNRRNMRGTCLFVGRRRFFCLESSIQFVVWFRLPLVAFVQKGRREVTKT